MSRPSRFLIAGWDGGGNVPPALNLAERLNRRGHRTRLLGWATMASRAANIGVDFRCYDSAPAWPATKSQDKGWEEVATFLHGPPTRDAICSEVEEFDPDVLVIDCMMGAGFEAAAQVGRRTAALVHVLHSAFAHGWGDGVMGTNVATLLGRQDVVVALTPPGLDVDHETAGNTAFVGPIQRERGLDQPDSHELRALTEPGDPWVLLSLSTTQQGQLEVLPTLLHVLGGLPVRVLLTLGPAVPAQGLDVPSNVTVREFVPHDVVLPHMAAVVTHAGLSTVTTALAHGVPMVCIPQGREQPLNAARVEAVGAGRVLQPGSISEQIGNVVEEVLNEPGLRARAAQFADAISALGAGATATDLVEALAP